MSDPGTGIAGFFSRNLTGIATIMVSAAVGFSGFWISRTNQTIAAADACRDRTLALYDQATRFIDEDRGKAPSVINHNGARIAIESQFVELTCGRAGMPVSEQLSAVLGEARGLLSDDASRDIIKRTIAVAGGPVANTAVPPPAASANTAPPATARLYIQISDENQRAGATALRDRLRANPPAGWNLSIAQGIERASPVGANELRCLKARDCAAAPGLADAIAAAGALTALPVRDLSQRYENAGGVKPGTFELWLAPGTLAGSGKPASTAQGTGSE
jgi:hypothetical protein